VQVRVLFFGRLKELVGAAEEEVELPAGASVADLAALYRSRVASWTEFQVSLAVAVNQEYANLEARLEAGDEVAFLPPVSGGAAPEQARNRDRIELVRAPIATGEIVNGLKAPGDGAVVVFDGIVRDHSGARKTLHLDYEAYEPMALAALGEIARELHSHFEVDAVALVHRLGRLEIGETSVLIAVSSAHRAAAFEACRHAIEQVKRTVPIWKKEYFADGAVWVEGHPLPAGREAVASAGRGTGARRDS
jgi:molybdopterin synthase catalytic subunit